jgi:uncharacterized RDD family membrane protein YckC
VHGLEPRQSAISAALYFEGIQALSTPATQFDPQPSWKQEVNLRLAAHKSRRDPGTLESVAPAERQAPRSRAALAAARVAARYAQAPSYSQMLAEEARAAVRAAEAVSHAALKAQAVAESVLAELESAAEVEPAHDAGHAAQPHTPTTPVQTTFFDPFLEVERPVVAHDRKPHPQGLQIRWSPDMPVRPAEPPVARASRATERLAPPEESWREPVAGYGEPETVEPAQPINANLIEFPREIVAARKARPRIAEGPLAADAAPLGQLSIFEVDPGAISIIPEPVHVHAAPDWSRIRLDSHPAAEPARAADLAAKRIAIHLAPFSLRFMAAVIDVALVVSLFVAIGLVAAANIDSPLAQKPTELVALAALFVLAALYQGFFFTFAAATPGMRYAGISLCNFDDERPTRTQLRRRLVALFLSLLPVGLGMLWAIFDEDHLSWHDRISRTYQRWG